jgi:hypothetical protein
VLTLEDARRVLLAHLVTEIENHALATPCGFC